MDYESAFSAAAEQAERILGDRASAEDVAAEAALRITLGGRAPRELSTIARNLAIDEYRRRSAGDIPVGLDELAALEELGAVVVAQGATLTIEDAEFRRDFDAAVRGLDGLERDTYILTELRGLTTREAADVLDTSHMTVHRRAEAARHLIRKEIA